MIKKEIVIGIGSIDLLFERAIFNEYVTILK